MFKKTLYGLEKDGTIKIWEVLTTDCHDGTSVLTVIHGQEGGKMQDKHTVIAEGKQKRTVSEQAISEAQGKIKKQIAKGYRETKEELKELPLLAMLAGDYNKVPHLLRFPCLVSKKLDGCRALAVKANGLVTLFSRGNKKYNVRHIEDQLQLIMEDGEVFDGELYIEDTPLQDIMSAVKKSNEISFKIEYLVFDLLSSDTFDIRYKRLIEKSLMFSNHIGVVEHFEANTEQDLLSFHERFVSLGYEGVMARNLSGRYESGKRSNDLLKYKTFQDVELQITGVVEDKNGNAVLLTWDKISNSELPVCYGDFQQRKLQLEDPSTVIGKWLTVKFQSRYKDSMKCQFPVGVQIRGGQIKGGEFVPDE